MSLITSHAHVLPCIHGLSVVPLVGFNIYDTLRPFFMVDFQYQDPIGTASANSVESDQGCTSRIYFDNVGANVTLAV